MEVSNDSHNVFTLEHVHNLHLGKSNLLKNCFISYVKSQTLCVTDGDKLRSLKACASLRSFIWQAYKALLAACEEKNLAARLHVDFLRDPVALQLKELSNFDDVQITLDEEDHQKDNIGFVIIVGFVDRGTG